MIPIAHVSVMLKAYREEKGDIAFVLDKTGDFAFQEDFSHSVTNFSTTQRMRMKIKNVSVMYKSSWALG